MSESGHKVFARELHEQFQERAPDFLAPNDDPELDEDQTPPEGGVLTGWFLVAEWVGADGDAWISYHRAPDQPAWRSRGLLGEAISDL